MAPATGAWTASNHLDTSTFYYRRGDVTVVYEPGGIATKYAYDGAGRLVSTAYGDGGGDAGSWIDAATTTGDRRRGTLTDFENQVHRMDYPTYVKKDWAIGSGPVEAACKTVIGRRLKGTGMRWRPDGAGAMAPLRALLVGERGQWTVCWDQPARAA